MRKIAILGGTFDPVHWGHLLMAQMALNQTDIEQVIWVPTGCPPHKLATKFEYRSEMVQEAISDHPAFIISPLAKNDSGPTYAIKTLIDLQAFYPNTYWYWIVGLDTFQTLPHWYRRWEMALMCDWLVGPRG
ncbi:MAG: nicotinate (nicotinamide) nucleotide adenylyltransferase, partial [Chroococcidiopsidaceae cyanobacterium CP_BM_ER_R8_30]|nr:nicotinate (nicotinamide) nucleotide adenylyltransferase [Chroococcidiopsidaceae cyanobacterium CP_BM_ER_R8_30]